MRPNEAVAYFCSCMVFVYLFSSTTRVASSFAVKSTAYHNFGVKRVFRGPFTMSTSSSTTAPDGDSMVTNAPLSACPSIPMRNGHLHPAIGFGTYKVGFVPASASSSAATPASSTTTASTTPPQRSAQECVSDALRVGYRCLECAEFYGNEAQVGLAIQQSGIPREELFLCSKVWTTTIEQGPEAVRAQFEKTLRDLQTNYLDLYLIHWPVPNHHVVAYRALQELQQQFPDKLKGIGVSNYAWEDYLELKEAGLSPPLVNQIEINPFLYRKNTIERFEKEGVLLQSYRSLRDGKAMDHPLLLEMAQKYNKTAAQILGRWCVQHGFIYLPKSVKKERMIENANVFDFSLSPTDLQALDQLTTPDALDTFQQLYRKCVNRDTSCDGTLEGVKLDITVD